MTDRSGTRPHFRIDHAFHGAMKDTADQFDLDHGEAYILATRVLLTLADTAVVDPTPDDDRLRAAYDTLLENCET